LSLLSKLTVTPLLYACGALALLSVGLSVALHVRGADLAAAQARTGEVAAERDAAVTERDAWKGEAERRGEANEAYADVVGTLHGELKLAQGERRRLEAAGRAAVAAAQAEARDAERTLQRLAAQFQAQSRVPDCAAATARVAQACPAFEGY